MQELVEIVSVAMPPPISIISMIYEVEIYNKGNLYKLLTHGSEQRPGMISEFYFFYPCHVNCCFILLKIFLMHNNTSLK